MTYGIIYVVENTINGKKYVEFKKQMVVNLTAKGAM